MPYRLGYSKCNYVLCKRRHFNRFSFRSISDPKVVSVSLVDENKLTIRLRVPLSFQGPSDLTIKLLLASCDIFHTSFCWFAAAYFPARIHSSKNSLHLLVPKHGRPCGWHNRLATNASLGLPSSSTSYLSLVGFVWYFPFKKNAAVAVGLP